MIVERMDKKIVVTGIGIVSSIGTGRETFWNNLLDGRSGISSVTSFDTADYPSSFGSEIKNFQAEKHVFHIDPSTIGRTSQMSIAAARLAIKDARLDLNAINLERAGISMGTTSGEAGEIERFDDHLMDGSLDRIGKEFINLYPCHVIPAHVANEFGFAGFNTMIPTACAAGGYAISHAFDVLRGGRADIMLAGGADSFSRITYSGFTRLGVVAPEKCQPFDKDRKGMIPGEGAAILVLEPLSSALKRKANIYAEISGYGLSCDAYHIASPHPEGDGAVRAMNKALKNAGIVAKDVHYVSAHGTGTITNDMCETIAVKRVFGEYAPRTPISSIKSMIGHTMGAASAIEAAVCCLTISTNRIPPTINYEEPDPECDLDVVPNEARDHNVDVAISNSFAFGGNNSSLIFNAIKG